MAVRRQARTVSDRGVETACVSGGAAEHFTSRVYCGDPGATCDQLTRRDSGAGADVEHPKSVQRDEHVEDCVRMRGSGGVVLVCDCLERGHGSHHAPTAASLADSVTRPQARRVGWAR